MAGYIIHEFVKDYSCRTRQNLNVIKGIYDEHSTDPDKKVYEVTQLINSLFGMIIVPYEKFKDMVKDSDYYNDPNYIEINDLIKDLKRNGFIRSTYDWDVNGVGVFSFIAHLRNALAHSGNGKLNFIPINKEDNIRAVFFLDKLEKNGKISYFCCRLSVKRIRKLCDWIPSLYTEVEKSIPEKERAEIYNRYNDQIKCLNVFLQGDDEVNLLDAFE